jgi:hyperosmotically inducible periplasmic protein
MKLIRRSCVASAALAGLCVVMLSMPGRMVAQAPDNSNQNKGQTQTADNQSNAKADRDITAKVRKEIMADKDLSTYAHNVKVITTNGAVTLKGPVKTEDEKAKVAELAANVVPAEKVTNELTVK